MCICFPFEIKWKLTREYFYCLWDSSRGHSGILIINMKCRYMYICQPSSMNVNGIRVIKVQMRTLCTQLLGTCFKNSSRDVAYVAKTQTLKIAAVVRKCFIKHMCFIVLYFHSHALFSLDIAKKCFFVLYFFKNVFYKLFKWVEFLF